MLRPVPGLRSDGVAGLRGVDGPVLDADGHGRRCTRQACDDGDGGAPVAAVSVKDACVLVEVGSLGGEVFRPTRGRHRDP